MSDRVEEFLAAPPAAAFFVLADRYRLNPDRLTRPNTTTALASIAIGELNPWMGTAARDRARVLRQVAPYGPSSRTSWPTRA